MNTKKRPVRAVAMVDTGSLATRPLDALFASCVGLAVGCAALAWVAVDVNSQAGEESGVVLALRAVTVVGGCMLLFGGSVASAVWWRAIRSLNGQCFIVAAMIVGAVVGTGVVKVAVQVSPVHWDSSGTAALISEVRAGSLWALPKLLPLK